MGKGVPESSTQRPRYTGPQLWRRSNRSNSSLLPITKITLKCQNPLMPRRDSRTPQATTTSAPRVHVYCLPSWSQLRHLGFRLIPGAFTAYVLIYLLCLPFSSPSYCSSTPFRLRKILAASSTNKSSGQHSCSLRETALPLHTLLRSSASISDASISWSIWLKEQGYLQDATLTLGAGTLILVFFTYI